MDFAHVLCSVLTNIVGSICLAEFNQMFRPKSSETKENQIRIAPGKTARPPQQVRV